MPKLKRYFCFSLRTLFLVTTILCIGMGLLGLPIKKSWDRKQAVETILSLGGDVHYQHVIRQMEPPGPKWLRQMFGDELFFRVDTVSLLGPRFNDKNIAVIKHLAEVRWLSSYHSKITDRGLRHLRSLNNLEELYLSGLSITDAGLKELEGLHRLKKLQIYACSLDITDDGKNRLVLALPQFKPTSDYPVHAGTLFLGNPN